MQSVHRFCFVWLSPAFCLGMVLLSSVHAASLREADAAFESGDHAAALAAYGTLAEGGDLYARIRVAQMYQEGLGVDLRTVAPAEYSQVTGAFRSAWQLLKEEPTR